jgi:hypothetical protein
MYGCDVFASADPIDPSSRSFRDAAINRRRAVMRRGAANGGVNAAEPVAAPESKVGGTGEDMNSLILPRTASRLRPATVH